MRYRKRRAKKTGRDFAQAHIQAGIEFSDEVGNADDIVKDAFFSLSGRARTSLLDKYEQLYGKSPRDYAQQTIPKWRTGDVHMSGLVAKRLFDLMPPLMPIGQKHLVVEKIWKRYGPHSKRYLFVGPDADRAAVLAEIEKYFTSLDVTHEIPATLERRFDWISDHDVTVKQQLLNHFMNEQRRLALDSVRLNLDMIIDQMNAESAGRIAKLSHTAFVGNHQLEIKADLGRTGFSFRQHDPLFEQPYRSYRNSESGTTPQTVKFGWKGWLVAAGIVVALYAWGQSHGSANEPPPAAVQQQVVQPAQADAQAPTALKANAAPKFVTDPAPTPKHADAVLRVKALPQHVVAQPFIAPAHASGEQVAALPAVPKAPALAAATGCSDLAIASVEDGGATVRVSNGSAYAISSAGTMQYAAGQWSTGDPVTVCLAASSDGTSASLSNPSHYAKVQATLTSTGTASRVSCQDERLTRVSNEGATIETTDGGSYKVSTAGTMRYAAGQWSTGDAVRVCRTSLSIGGTAAAISNPSHYSKVQTMLASAGSAATVSCTDVRLTRVSNQGASIDTTDGGSYSVSTAGTMRYAAGQWSTGDAVEVCRTTLSDGTTAAAISNPSHYSKIQATSIAQNRPTTVTCKASTIAAVKGGGATVSLVDGNTYTISSAGTMRYAAGQWTSGDSVNICEAAAADGSIAASIQNAAHYAKIQATRS